MIVAGLSGAQYQLDSVISDGGEGTIYRVLGTGTKLVAKVYKPGVPSYELEEKLKYMMNRKPSSSILRWIAWPMDIIYDMNRQFCGFVMPGLNINAELGEIYKYPSTVNISTYHKIIIAENICTVISEVHKVGYVFGDFNPRNIGVDRTTGNVAFLDTDSYHIIIDRYKNKAYRCNVCAPGYAAPELLEKCSSHIFANPYDKDKAYAKTPLDTFTKETDNFALAIHIFKLLMNGFTPFGGIKDSVSRSLGSPGVGDTAVRRDSYSFKPGNKPLAIATPRLDSFPNEIVDLFTRAFINGKADPTQRPSAMEWKTILGVYEKTLVTCAKNRLHQYDRSNHACPLCEADDRYINKDVGADMSSTRGTQTVTQKDFGSLVLPPVAGSTSNNNTNSGQSVRPTSNGTSSNALQNQIVITLIILLGIGLMVLPFYCGFTKKSEVAALADTTASTVKPLLLDNTRWEYVDQEGKKFSMVYGKEVMLFTCVNRNNVTVLPQSSWKYTLDDNILTIINEDGDERYTEKYNYFGTYIKSISNPAMVYTQVTQSASAQTRPNVGYSEALRQNQTDAKEYYNKGKEYYDKSDYDRAIVNFTEAIRLNPNYAAAYCGRGDAYDSKKDYGRAIADYTEAIRLNPNYPAAYNNMGNAYNSKKDYDRAIADYTEAIRLNPKDAVPYINRGNAYYNKKDYDRAIADYTEAIRLNPKYATAYKNRGNAYKSKGDKARAEADYTQARRLDYLH